MSTPLPRNDELASQFDLLADLIELEDGDRFRIAAYRRAAARIRESTRSVAELALAGQATTLPGIGKTIEGKVREAVELGEMRALTKHRQGVPAEVVSFLRLPGLGPKTAARIWRELGVTTLEELRQAAEGERLRTLVGVGPKLEQRLLVALEQPREQQVQRALLGRVLPALAEILPALRAFSGVELVSEAGSARRRRESLHDVDLVASAADPASLTEAFAAMPLVAEVLARGETKATVLSHDGLRYDLRVVRPGSFGNLLQHFTGSKAHNVALREDAVRRGLSVSEYGVSSGESGELFRTDDEDELYRYLGYQPIPPELREGGGELEAARAGELPALVELADVRGDLHAHSTWSDGRATIEEMALAARERGYAYLAVTDHSPRLREGRIEAQWREIEALSTRLAPFRILRGVEVNIRVDGSLDLPDDTLAQLDWVIASLHSSFERSPTERLLAAAENPLVDCIGHPSGRRIGSREPPVAIERVIARAAEIGTALEINGQPDRLDLRDSHARLAREAGAKIVLASDAHRPSTLAYLELALAQARRAWLTSDHLLNTLPWTLIERQRRRS
ncbi:MAG: DNA polymerase/3'-5' exonuclease PolX [Gaiellaceae bacterium]